MDLNNSIVNMAVWARLIPIGGAKIQENRCALWQFLGQIDVELSAFREFWWIVIHVGDRNKNADIQLTKGKGQIIF